MAVKKLSAIASGGAVAGATDTVVTVRSGTTDVLTTPVTLDLAQVFSKAQGITVTDAATTTVTTLLTLDHETSGTPGVGFGSQILFNAMDTTTAGVNQCAINSIWSTAVHASRYSQMQFQIVNNAGSLSTALTLGSNISGGTAGWIIGGTAAGLACLWNGGIATPSGLNYALIASTTSSALAATTTVNLNINGSSVVTLTSTTFQIPKVTTYNSIATAGIGVAAVYAATNTAGLSAAATLTSYTTPAADGDYEVSASVNVSAATAISTSINVTYTDVGNNSRTLTLPVQLTGGTGGTYLTNGLVIATGDYCTPVTKIRVKASTTITILTATGTFTGVTYSGSGNIKQPA